MKIMINYEIIASGSKGNAVIINKNIMVDCGVPFIRLKKYVKELKLVLLTHVHSDHFNKSTIKTLAFERPSLRFACGEWLLQNLTDCGIAKANIDVLQSGRRYTFGICGAEPFELTHNVRNFGWKLYIGGKKMIYATDTNSLDGVTAKDFDLYMIEANYKESEMTERIINKLRTGGYAYETEVRENHLSKEKADEFIYGNIGQKGAYVYMHSHDGLIL